MLRFGNRRHRQWRVWAIGALVIIFSASACADSADVQDTHPEAETSVVEPASSTASTTSPATSITDGAPLPTVTTTKGAAATSTTETTRPTATSSVPSASTTTTTCPAGVPYDGLGPRVGDQVGVVGVAFDDSLNVRSGPGVEYGVVATLPPTANSIGVTGRALLFPSSLWYEIDTDGAIGWVNALYIAFLGATDDATSEVVAVHGSIPAADTMLALGAVVSEYSTGDDAGGRIVLTVAPSVGSPGEITYDVVGLTDDAISGYRLHVFGQQDHGVGPFSLHTVERTSLCWRGVTVDGLCV